MSKRHRKEKRAIVKSRVVVKCEKKISGFWSRHFTICRMSFSLRKSLFQNSENWNKHMAHFRIFLPSRTFMCSYAWVEISSSHIHLKSQSILKNYITQKGTSRHLPSIFSPKTERQRDVFFSFVVEIKKNHLNCLHFALVFAHCVSLK